LHAQVWCALQIGFFKAKQTFFTFAWDEVPHDRDFVLSRYFADISFEESTVTRHEHYAQRAAIAQLFGYRLWSGAFLGQIEEQARQIVRRDVTPGFVVAELVAWLNANKVERPGYSRMQRLVSEALGAERRHIEELVAAALDAGAQEKLSQLLVRDDALSELAALKQDAKNFGWRQMAREREKRATLEPLYLIARQLLPALGVSQQNLSHYADLANFYTVYDLRRMKPGQAHLYLLCYAWQRYRQFTDNLVDALGYHMKQLEDETKDIAQQQFVDEQLRRQKETPKVGRVLLLYVDDTVADSTAFGDVRRRAFKILPREAVQAAGQRLSIRSTGWLLLRWQAVDKVAGRMRRHLRPLFETLVPSGAQENCPWLAALDWMKDAFGKQESLSRQSLAGCPEATLPRRLKPYLLEYADDGEPVGVHAERYEFWVYRQLRKRLKSGEVYVDDSHQHRHFCADLVSPEKQQAALEQLDIPWVREPLEDQLAKLGAELRDQWQAFEQELRDGKLEHLDHDPATGRFAWHRLKANENPQQQDAFYGQLPLCDVADVLRFVDQECGLLSALTPLQPRYAKQAADRDSLMAVIASQAMNHGTLLMSKTSDIPYHVLEFTHQQYLRQATLQAANDRISNAIAELPIFEHYSFDLETLYASVDGQKFGVPRPTVKARHSRKYFGRGKGVVAYTLLCNHVPLQSWMIGAHDFEAHHVFDIWYRNTCDIVPEAITGDMHSVNKANFAILHWFGLRFEPRFTDLDKQLADLRCTDDPKNYEGFIVRPAGQIDLELIRSEKANIDRIVATLGLKEITQGTLIRKLCTHTSSHPTWRAIFEYDRLVRSVYTLRYLRDPQLQRNVHRSQNRIESYHQLRAAIAKVGGKKELTGRTDLDIETSNQCGRLVANAILFYNSAILSRLLVKGAGNPKALELITSMSPAAWRHVHLGGHYTFRGDGPAIDLDAIIQGLDLT